MNDLRRRWADKYGSEWYKHLDGKPPLDDDNDYVWNAVSQRWGFKCSPRRYRGSDGA